MTAKYRHYFLGAVIFVVALYVGSYSILYANRQPAANLAYFDYLGDGVPEYTEQAVYYFYYPIYKLHRLFGAGRHNSDRDIL